jgi:ABC-type multidrug transport system permease subunit
VQALGLAMTLLFGLVGGSFFGSLPSGLMGILGMITPNYWGQKGFIILADGGGVQDLLPVYAALLAMGAVLLVISTLVFRKKGMLQR